MTSWQMLLVWCIPALVLFVVGLVVGTAPVPGEPRPTDYETASD
jgi:hypothetical protein